MNALQVEITRGSLVESTHRVSAAVVDGDGRLLASVGDPSQVTFWRSAAKPLQALPLIQDGAADKLGLTAGDLALACASHSSEPFHLTAVDQFLVRAGVREEELACGPHQPLSAEVAKAVVRDGVTMTPRWSNCSGKHTGMVAMTRHRGWAVLGYERAGHPTQERILAEVERWTGIRRGDVVLAVDGCTTVCFGLPLTGMAVSYARFGTSTDAAAATLRAAIYEYPHYIAGTGRLCTDLMRAWPGQILAKVGAEGVYSAAVPGRGWGIALKVEDGDMRCAGIALLGVLRRLLARFGDGNGGMAALSGLTSHAEPAIENTRGEATGKMQVSGQLRFE